MSAVAPTCGQIGEENTCGLRKGFANALVLRPYVPSDRVQVTELLQFLPLLYPNADAWLDGRLADVERGNARCTLATLPNSGALIGLTIETPKIATSLKLSTIFVRERYRGHGAGGALLRRARRRWIADRVQSVHVTVDAGRRHLIEPLLRSTDFDLIAIERDRYANGRDELVFRWNAINRQIHHRPAHLPFQ